MTDPVPASFPAYLPDQNIARRKAEQEAKPKPPLTVDKPISFRVTRTKQSLRPHYPRKARKRKMTRDPRDVIYY